MMAIAQERCFRHDVREAAGRCPACRRYYCRECLTEHDHRLLCVTCLARMQAAPPASARRWRWDYTFPLVGMLVAFTLLYWLGQTLILATTDFRVGE